MPWHINNLTGIPTVDRCSQTKTTYKDALKYENIIIYKKKNKHKTKKKKLKICLILHNWCLVYVQDFKSNKFLKNKTKQTQKHIEAYTKYKTYIRAEAAKRKR